jgi:hypothetical protein
VSTAGATNKGGGGGGGSEHGGGYQVGSAGGSGIVVLRINNEYEATIGGGLTSSTSTSVAGVNIYTFTAGSDNVSFSLA